MGKPFGRQIEGQWIMGWPESALSRNHAVRIQRKGAKTRRRKVRKGNWLVTRSSPFGDLDPHGLHLLCVVAPWRPCVEIRLPY